MFPIGSPCVSVTVPSSHMVTRSAPATDLPSANRLTINVLAAVAEHEREMISERTTGGSAAGDRRRWPMGVATLGPGADPPRQPERSALPSPGRQVQRRIDRCAAGCGRGVASPHRADNRDDPCRRGDIAGRDRSRARSASSAHTARRPAGVPRWCASSSDPLARRTDFTV
jgi:hypothetical protein